jgi:6-phosphogluconolactonase (cycloisomerase 2 family)
MTLTVRGSAFVNGAKVMWSGSDLVTTFASSTQLTAVLPTNRTASPGTFQVAVENPTPGGGMSNSMTFTVENGVPSIGSLSPASALAGGPSFSVTVDGSNFVNGAVVSWAGVSLPTQFVNDTQLIAQVPAAGIIRAGSAQVTVLNPAPGGGTSSAIAFDIRAVTPRFVYAAMYWTGVIQGYVVDESTGELHYNGYTLAGGANGQACAIAVSRDRRFLFANNYDAGTISVFQIDQDNGALAPAPGSPYPAGVYPQFFAEHPSGRFVYVSNYGSGDVSGYAVDNATGTLTPIGGSPFAAGLGSGEIALSLSGDFLFVPNYDADTISAFSIDPNSGALVPVPGSPFASVGSGPWGASVDPSGRYLIVSNENSVNVTVYSIDSAGAISAVPGSPFTTGVYPQPVTIDSSGRFVFVPDYMDGQSGAIHVFALDPATGNLTAVAGSPFPAGRGVWKVVLNNSASVAYAADFNSFDVATFAVDPGTGALTSQSVRNTSTMPWALGIVEATTRAAVEPKFAYFGDSAANQTTGYGIDGNTGLLTSLGSVPTVATPSAIALDPQGMFMFMADSAANSVSVFNVDPNGGSLTALPANTVATGTGPKGIAVDPAGRFLYVANEGSSQVQAFLIDRANGSLSLASSIACPKGPSALAVDPTGRYLYVNNTGSNDRTVFIVNLKTGALSLLGTQGISGTNPESLGMDPLFRFLYVANFDSGTIQANKFQVTRGWAHQQGLTTIAGKPSAVAVESSGRFAYVTDFQNNAVLAYSVDPANGRLTLINVFPTGTSPVSVSPDPSGRFLYVLNSASHDVTIFSIDGNTGELTTLYTMTLGFAPSSSALSSVMQ